MSEQVKYRKLFEPTKLGRLELKNRIVFPALAVSFNDEEGRVTQRTIDYFEARARGGVGLIIIGLCSVEFSRGLTYPGTLALDDDKHIPGMMQLVQMMHKHDVKVAVQLHHGGGAACFSLTGVQPVAPSPVTCRPWGDVPRELTIPEIKMLVNRFAQAAERGVRAGVDGIEIHGSSGYLFNQFLSRAKNKRRDEYGGDLKNRARFLLEVMAAVREKAGQGFPIWVKVQGEEFGTPLGITVEEAVETARMIEKAGAAAISVAGYANTSGAPFVRTEEPAGSNLHLAAGIKKAVGIPVLAVGRITAEAGEQALLEGKTDLVAMARALLADPELPAKAASGRDEDINNCITCLGCQSSNEPTRCTVNPALGREREFAIRKAEKAKKVVVVGGGPAGMEAALVAALRGHDVTLLERDRHLGGKMRLAYRVPHYSRIRDFMLYLDREVRKSGVKVEHSRNFAAADIVERKPDAVVLATGGRIPLRGRVVAMCIIGLARIGYPRIMEERLMVKTPSRRRQFLGVQTPLLAASKPDLALLPALRGRISEIYLAGDCLEPSGIMQAVADGARVGHSL